MATIVKELPKEEVAKFRNFKHLYAGANTIMSDGKKLIFGGPTGGAGVYTTNKADEIEYLEKLSSMSGSMITEIALDKDGRTVVVEDESIQHDIEVAVSDSRANSAAEVNPSIVAARENLAQNIAKG
jgi:hypothetical protein